MKAIENQSINLNLDVHSLVAWLEMSERKDLDFINFLKMSFFFDIFFRHSAGQMRLSPSGFNNLFDDPKTP